MGGEQTLRVFAHYLSGLEITAYYKCFNTKINKQKNIFVGNNDDIMRNLRINITLNICQSQLKEVNKIIKQFVDSLNQRRSRFSFGNSKTLKQLVSDLKSLKKC